jgi:CRP/FNR family cyclic AMP-dependent transcriptional regulator
MEKNFRANDESPAPKKTGTPTTPDAAPALPPLGILVGMNPCALASLASFGQYHRLPAETEIIREGERQDRFYVVVTGELEVSAFRSGKNVRLSVARKGECLGEVSLLEPGPASATIRVTKDATLWSMDMAELRAYLMENTGDAGIMLMGMASCLSSRLRQADRMIAEHHVLPTRTLPRTGETQAISASNTPVHLSFFEKIKRKLVADNSKKVRISTKIKM